MAARPERHEELERSLTNMTPGTQAVLQIEYIRDIAKQLGHAILDVVPACRQQSLAITKLEECTMWAVKALVLEGEE